ncbi:hypothetical protein AGOR_G00092500 [Albula goreensis]|uniref:CH033 n=1 Tax=Albula goreensis TaxID=1534307 RepID=A0A8T3DK34_9TELE|nr:hypothetical protein AGOR_G00092500 [Albula goreensis]
MEEAPWGTYQDELDWCIQQLQTDLLRGNTSPQEVEEKERVLCVLQSQGTPAVRKRQVMKLVFGDYRQRMTEEHKAQQETGPDMQENGTAVRESQYQRSSDGGFGWVPSDNSFTFSFFPDGTTSMLPTAVQEMGQSSTVSLTGEGSGFSFNFQIPTERSTETETGLSECSGAATAATGERREDNSENQDSKQSSENSAPKGKKKKKTNKKKHGAEGAGGQQKQSAASQGEAASHTEETGGLSTEQQLIRELDWCIEQLELGLRTQKSSPKQMEEASRALKTLRSSKAPLVKKRQVMRTMFGDYRKKMEEDKAKQFKQIQAAVKSARVTAVAEPAKKPVFHRKAESKTQTQFQKPGAQRQEEIPGPSRKDYRRCVQTG